MEGEELNKTEAELEAARVEADNKTEEKPDEQKTDDTESRLDAMYKKFEEAQKAGQSAPVTTSTTTSTTVTSGERVINTAADYNKWKEEDPAAAEAWMIQQVTRRTIAEDDAKKAHTERSKVYIQNERAVLSRHVDGINPDGTVKRDHPWIKAYIQVGKENPQLLATPNGPLLAEAMADKMVNQPDKIKEQSYNDGVQDEAARAVAANNARTGASTTSRPAPSKVELSPAHAAMAKRYGMSPEEWVKYSTNKVIGR